MGIITKNDRNICIAMSRGIFLAADFILFSFRPNKKGDRFCSVAFLRFINYIMLLISQWLPELALINVGTDTRVGLKQMTIAVHTACTESRLFIYVCNPVFIVSDKLHRVKLCLR